MDSGGMCSSVFSSFIKTARRGNAAIEAFPPANSLSMMSWLFSLSDFLKVLSMSGVLVAKPRPFTGEFLRKPL